MRLCYNKSNGVIRKEVAVMTIIKKGLLKKVVATISAMAIILSSVAGIKLTYTWADSIKYEAEDAKLIGTTINENATYSGKKGVTMRDSGSIVFTIEIEEDGFFDIALMSSGTGGDKENRILLDGKDIGVFSSTKDKLSKSLLKMQKITKGTHELSIEKSWGWMQLDYIEIEKSTGASNENYSVSKKLVSKKNSASALRLMSFLVDNYGKNVISGQVDDNGLDGAEMRAIKKATGKTPAMLGVDFMRDTPSRIAKGDRSNAVSEAIEFANAGGIVEICWHWNAPEKYIKPGIDSNGNPNWWGGFYKDNSTIDLAKIMNQSDKEGYDLLMQDIDAIGERLKVLEKADVPVLFRPLHEASGGWFWWGASGADAYKELWIVMFDKLTNEHGLSNIIWVWNGQNAAWYPGDEYVDIIGEDIYAPNHTYSPQSSKFLEVAEYSDEKKIVALTENGCLFDIDDAILANSVWAWFCTWGGEFCQKNGVISESHTSLDMWNEVYNHKNVITLDEMPDLKTYPLEGGSSPSEKESTEVETTQESNKQTESTKENETELETTPNTENAAKNETKNRTAGVIIALITGVLIGAGFAVLKRKK